MPSRSKKCGRGKVYNRKTRRCRSQKSRSKRPLKRSRRSFSQRKPRRSFSQKKRSFSRKKKSPKRKPRSKSKSPKRKPRLLSPIRSPIRLPDPIRSSPLIHLTPFIKQSPAKKLGSLFRGTPYYEIMALIFLMKKHPNDCIILPMKNSNKIYHEEDYSIYWEFNGNKSTLTFPDIMSEQMSSKCIGKRFIAIAVTLYDIKKDIGHANFIIMDTFKRTAERFEPYGKTKGGLFIGSDKLDEKLSTYFKTKFNFRYISPMSICPMFGLQALQAEEEYKHYLERAGDPEGFCSVWSIFFCDIRLSNPDEPADELLEKTIEEFKNKPTRLTNFVRNYSTFIIRDLDTVLSRISRSKNVAKRTVVSKHLNELITAYLN